MLNLTPALPEIFILTMACVVLLVDVYQPRALNISSYQLIQGTLIIALLISIFVSGTNETDAQLNLSFNALFINDPLAVILKRMALLITIASFAYCQHYHQQRNIVKGEFYILGLFAVLGTMVLISAHSLLTLYLGLELLSLSLYTLVAMERDSSEATESAMKYFVLGAMASGMLLYGMSMIYGVTGSISLDKVAESVVAAGDHQTLLTFGLVFIVVGLSFKLGVVPFHMWLPDVYQGASTPVTLFVATAPKIAAFALMFRLLVDGLGDLVAHWQNMLVVFATLSIALGNVVAIAQTNIKRMLAYSTIAHMGYLLLGMIAGTDSGYAASMYYVMVYALMSAGAFGIIILFGRTGFECDQLDDFKGMAVHRPWYAAVMLILMFSMAGVPPFVGFWAKWFVIKEVIEAGYVWLAVFALFFSIIGAFYYIRVVRLMYFDKTEEQVEPVHVGKEAHYLLTANGLSILLLGLIPGILMGVCLKAVGS